MNPGLVVKLRPAGPWRIGPDSGARNRVDFIYHSDSLYSAVVSAMARLGTLDAWLDATARRGEAAPPPAVCFSSCFPFLDDIGYVVPPRTVWPPVSRALKSARVRWKSARFVPLGVVQAILAGQRLDENHWSVDGASECLVPAGKPGPFRTAVRWSAAVDRLTGSTERHSTACLEFRQGAGLWTVVSFLDEAAYSQWLEPVKAAFRLLADTGFGGERSRGWGRAESPEFIEGALPDMILPPSETVTAASNQTAESVIDVSEVPVEAAMIAEPEPVRPVAARSVEGHAIAPAAIDTAENIAPEAVATSPEADASVTEAPSVETALPLASLDAAPGEDPGPEDVPVKEPSVDSPPSEDPEPVPVKEPPVENPPVEEPPAEPGEPIEGMAAVRAPSDLAPLDAGPASEPPSESEPVANATPEASVESASTTDPLPPVSEPEVIASPETASESEIESTPVTLAPEVAVPAPVLAAPSVPGHPHWLLSLFTPSAADAVDWRRGNYTVLARGGRVDSPAGSGELKKQIQMVAEGSVVYAPSGPCGSAADVAPDGFAHPVFRAGFAVSIPLPEVS